MTLSEELSWRGFINQTTIKDLSWLDQTEPISFYFGVDPSADSMTIGHLTGGMLARHLTKHGHKAFMLVGGATGMIGDPDGKSQERNLLTKEEINLNKEKIKSQMLKVCDGQDVTAVDNYDWFKDMNYLNFLRDIGKHVPLSQMLGREFVQTRLDGSGISYAEFSYALIQAYDFYYLYKENGVSLQICGGDQWGNSIAGVDLIRRLTGKEANVLSTPLIINKATGVKFGKTEAGAVWLDEAKTSATQFYQFWINVDDEGVEEYLKIYTELTKEQIESVLAESQQSPQKRIAQKLLAKEVTTLVHGRDKAKLAENVTAFLTGSRPLSEADDDVLKAMALEIPVVDANRSESLLGILVKAGLAKSNSDGRQLINGSAITIDSSVIKSFDLPAAIGPGLHLLRRGKAYKDSALVHLH